MLPFYYTYTGPDGKPPKIVLDKLTGVPIRYGYSNYFDQCPSIKFSVFYDKDFMINLINNILDNFGELISARSYYEHDCSWIIEWGMKPLEETVETYQEVRTIKLGRVCALKAATIAQDKFDSYDYFEYQDDYYYWYNAQNGGCSLEHIPRNWCSIKIELSFCLFKNMYKIHIYKKFSSHDSLSYYYVSEKFGKKINEVNTNYLWIVRKNYLQLLEGLPSQTGRDNVLTYLLNDGIVKAVCELIG